MIKICTKYQCEEALRSNRGKDNRLNEGRFIAKYVLDRSKCFFLKIDDIFGQKDILGIQAIFEYGLKSLIIWNLGNIINEPSSKFRYAQ